MSLLSDIFNPTLLIILGITILLLALLVLYFESKMRDQNHKIASMLSLVSSLAEETGIIKMHLNHVNITNGGDNTRHENNVSYDSNINTTKYFDPTLITVSDNDADEDTSSSDDDSDNSDEEYDDSDSDDSDDDMVDNDKNKNITINEINENDIKVLNLGNLDDEFYKVDNENDYNADDSDDDDHDDDDDDENLEDINFDQLSDNDSVLDISKPIEKIEIKHTILESMETPEINENKIKSIKINLEEDKKNTEVIDYKKLSLNKLKSVVLEKGLTQDPSKLKKHELLKLLNVE